MNLQKQLENQKLRENLRTDNRRSRSHRASLMHFSDRIFALESLVARTHTLFLHLP